MELCLTSVQFEVACYETRSHQQCQPAKQLQISHYRSYHQTNTRLGDFCILLLPLSIFTDTLCGCSKSHQNSTPFAGPVYWARTLQRAPRSDFSGKNKCSFSTVLGVMLLVAILSLNTLNSPWSHEQTHGSNQGPCSNLDSCPKRVPGIS